VHDLLENSKRQGQIRQMLLRGPSLSVAILIACPAAVLLLLSPEHHAESLGPTVIASIMFVLALLSGMLSLLPLDQRCVPLVCVFVQITVATLLLAMYSRKGFKSLLGDPCILFDIAVPCPQKATTNAIRGTGMLLMIIWLLRAIWLKQSSSRLLNKMWRGCGLNCGIASVCVLANGITVSVEGVGLPTLGYIFLWLFYTGVGFFCFQERWIHGMQSWLMSRGGASTAAAGIAQLLDGRSAEEVLANARNNFMYVSADSILQEDMFDNKPNPKLAALSKKGKLGHVDAFLSHSWHDDPAAKWACLQAYRESFKKEHNGREPKLWIDKYCLNQNRIDDSLACLPVYLAGCRKLVILCGTTYLQRLWCLVEMFVFLKMGGVRSNLEVHIIESQNTLNDGMTREITREITREMTREVSVRETASMAVRAFNFDNARCFTDYDTERLRGVVEIAGREQIEELVDDVFLNCLRII